MPLRCGQEKFYILSLSLVYLDLIYLLYLALCHYLLLLYAT